MTLTPDERQRITTSLISLMVVEHQKDRLDEEGWEFGLLRMFACSFACLHALDDEEDGQRLFDELFTTYCAVLNCGSTERWLSHRAQICERFSRYYEATDWIGKASEHNVRVQLPNVSGGFPFEAFVRMEVAFRSFARPDDVIAADDLIALARDPMSGRFGQFLRMWDEAMEHIHHQLDEEEQQFRRDGAPR